MYIITCLHLPIIIIEIENVINFSPLNSFENFRILSGFEYYYFVTFKNVLMYTTIMQ